MTILIPLACIVAICLLWPIFTADKDPNALIRKKQQRALNWHHKAMMH